MFFDGIHKPPSSLGGCEAGVSKDARQPSSHPRKLVALAPILLRIRHNLVLLGINAGCI
jgi:hypothetical protein